MNSPLPYLARVRALPPPAVDRTLAGMLVVAVAVEALAVNAPIVQGALAVAAAAVGAAGLIVRRRAPLTGAALLLGATCGVGLLEVELVNTISALYVGFAFSIYSLVAAATGRRLAAGLAIAALGVLATSAISFQDQFDWSLGTALSVTTAFFVIAPFTAGRLLRSRLELAAAIGERTKRLQDDRLRQAEEAAAAERARIAGELHDVVAHALGAMTVQAAAARRLASTKAELAAGAFEAIEQTGRDALGELRTILDALRDDDQPDQLRTAKPSLARLDELAAALLSAGLRVTVAVQGAPPSVLATGVDVAAYRLVEMALDSALNDGGAITARVQLRYRPDRLEVEVSDDGVRVEGRRLLGLQERVGMFGGAVQAEPDPAGGHAVRAWLPLEAVAA